ncbi:prokaryotic phospholipase A2-domain-containing protein [Microdochium trichocladiopsis]|uniref:Prokaryotic phospholipase A2-domain-containing protein n=1 Tax=Microdochium trichocladiopsis TaxID=1682393 RepID=A0A9P8Y7U9_9PEZI|nr:prokaryotic phospholipase A2-domain-containing protein [Microdochium trichocladiopsis]KAH7032732.1 prokaryotic phospholipase A2-domain-containing protein [Microdochium trichocladiopsis]
MKSTLILSALVALGFSNPIPVSSPSQETSTTTALLLSSRQTAALNAETDRLLFTASIGSFIASRDARNPATLDWSSDGCSSSPDNPLGFDFLSSCYRHDFGYRNYKAQGRFDDAGKLRIDNNFREDLYDQCERESARDSCRFTADVYYQAVRWFGSRQATIVEEGNELVLLVDGTEVERVSVR